MYKVYLLPLLILVLAITPLLAQQPTQPVRLELDYDSYKTRADIIATSDSSLLVFTKTEGSWNVPPTFEFTKYNHLLASSWTKKVELDPLTEYLAHFSEPPYTYVAFRGESMSHFQFVKLNLKSGSIVKHEYKIEAIDSIYVFKVVAGNYVVVARSKKNGSPTLLHINDATNEVRPLPAVYGVESTFSDVQVHPTQKQVSVVLSESNGKISRLQTKLFDGNGKLLANYFIHPYLDKRPLFAEITPGDTTQRLLIGTYASRSLRYASGFFTSPVTADVGAARFYSFLQLKNFFRHMPPKREERTRRRETDRLKAQKEPSLQYQLLLHDVYTTNNGYILSAEVYSTQSREGGYNRIYGPTSYFMRAPRTYRRSQAIALGFDRNGVLLWDNSFKLEDRESPELNPTVEVAYSPEGKVVIAYPDEDEIHYKVMDHDIYNEDKTKLQLQAKNPDSKILSTSMAGIVSWYGLNFVAFGWHRVKAPGAEIRNVFYLNKISF